MNFSGLTGKPRRDAYLRVKRAERALRRAQRRKPSPHAVVITEMKIASLFRPRNKRKADTKRFSR